jgi:hypothetical protein
MEKSQGTGIERFLGVKRAKTSVNQRCMEKSQGTGIESFFIATTARNVNGMHGKIPGNGN